MTILQDVQQPNPGTYLELFQIDTTAIDPANGEVLYWTPNNYNGTTPVQFQGNVYTFAMIEATGFQWASDGAAPRPVLTVGNVNRELVSLVSSLGDMCGATVRRYRVFLKYLDGQSHADPTQYVGPDVFIIQQKTSHTNISIQFSLSSPLDQSLMLPRRQILRDKGFPGAGRVRFR